MFNSVQNRNLKFACQINGVSGNALDVIEFNLKEELSGLFKGELILVSDSDSLSAEQCVDQDATLSIFCNTQLEREFRGVIQSFSKKDTGKDVTFYAATLVPSFARLELRQNSRIFQHKTVIDIAKLLFSEMQLRHVTLALRHTYKERIYCVQWQETDFEFIQRLFAEEGILYYFENTDGKEIIVLSDDRTVLPLLEKNCSYNSRAGGMAAECYIRQFSVTKAMATTEAVLKTYDFKRPKYTFLKTAPAEGQINSQGNYEHYDFPGRFDDDEVGSAFTKTRINALRQDADTAEGISNIPYLLLGHLFELKDHPEDNLNALWLLTTVNHSGKQPQALKYTGDSGMTVYENVFTAVPEKTQWKPKHYPKKNINGVQMAVVVGPKDEEIYCNEHGMIKVQFAWDREGEHNENSSCWVRVMHSGAGTHYGNINIPRIGHEVLVIHEDGDPDRPLVIGSMFNALNQTPDELPKAKTKMIMRSKTHKGKGFNEMSFEDDAGKEEIYFHAQKNMKTLVLNDRVQHIKHDEHHKIEHDIFHQVFNQANYTVDKERRSLIKANDIHIVEGDLHQDLKNKWLVETGDELHWLFVIFNEKG